MSNEKRDGEAKENKFIETLRDGPLKVSIFRNQGTQGSFYSLDPGRIYTDEKSGDVREVSSLSGSEPLRMAHLLTKGYERVGELRQQDKEHSQDDTKQDRRSRSSRSRDDDQER